jgi:glycosyltransferase involved in cell wall biosynthesis
MKPLITVVLPIYNGAEFLRAAIDSILQQTETRFELLCIDDGSKDDSAAIVRSYSDPRIKLLQHPNRGLCGTVNRGIEEAQAPFIARNDQDDLSVPDRLEKQLQYLQANPDVGCVFTHYQKVGRARTWDNLDKQSSQDGEVRPFRGLPDGCQLASTMLARAEVLRAVGGFRQAYYPADDWDVQLRLVERFTVRILTDSLVIYRFHLGANTYPLFSTMQVKGRWAEDSHQRRRAGLPERTFDEFRAADRGGFGLRVRRAIREFAALNLRMAGQHLLDGRRAAAVARGALSFLANPGEIVGRFRRRRAARRGIAQ